MIAALFAAGLASAADRIEWKESCSTQAVVSVAGQAGKPVMLGIFAPWCTACRELEANVLASKEVIELASVFEPLRCDGDTPEGEKLMADFHAVGFPTVLFLDRGGKEIDRLFDNTEIAAVVAIMKDIKAGKTPLVEATALAEKNLADPKLAFEVGSRWAYRGDEEKANRYLSIVLAKDADNKLGLASSTYLTLGKFLYLRGKKSYEKAIRTLDELRKRYPESEEARQAASAIAQAFLGLGREDKAAAALDGMIAENPDYPGAYNSYAWFCYRNKFRIDRGIEMAKKGIEIDPADDGLWDTLAELQFASGKKAEAIKSAEQALKLKPEDEYYKKQVKKFRGGK